MPKLKIYRDSSKCQTHIAVCRGFMQGAKQCVPVFYQLFSATLESSSCLRKTQFFFAEFDLVLDIIALVILCLLMGDEFMGKLL